jgi:hypothetical protein
MHFFQKSDVRKYRHGEMSLSLGTGPVALSY